MKEVKMKLGFNASFSRGGSFCLKFRNMGLVSLDEKLKIAATNSQPREGVAKKDPLLTGLLRNHIFLINHL